MKNFILFIGLFSIIGCANPKKLHKMMDKLTEATAIECSDRFPIKETIDTVEVMDTTLLKIYEQELYSLWRQLDSVLNGKVEDSIKTVIKTIIKDNPVEVIKYKHIVKTKENTAKLEVLKNDCNKTITSLSQINTQNVTKIHKLELDNGKLKTRLSWMWIIIIILTVFSFRRQIAKLIIK
jgi:hypothetical protein